MHRTRELLFAKITLRSVNPLPFFDNPRCTVFPYVQELTLDGNTDNGSEFGMLIIPTWLDDFFHHMPKFTVLTSLSLYTLGSWEFEDIVRAMPPSINQHIQKLTILCPNSSMATIAAVISNFAHLTTLEIGEMQGGWRADALARLLPTNEVLPPPPSRITKLVFWEAGHLPSNVLKWFTDLHPGRIESLTPHILSAEHPAEFGDFLNRFGASLSEIELSITDEDEICRRIYMFQSPGKLANDTLQCNSNI